jgi:hypothetical protein
MLGTLGYTLIRIRGLLAGTGGAVKIRNAAGGGEPYALPEGEETLGKVVSDIHMMLADPDYSIPVEISEP